MKRNRNKVPIGFINKQIGGCNGSMYHSNNQSGGFAIIPAVAAAYGFLKSVQPFSKANKALEENVPDEKKNHLAYKIASKITGVGKSLGFGQSASILGPIKYPTGTSQTILASKRRKQAGAGKRKKQTGAGKRKTKSKK